MPTITLTTQITAPAERVFDLARSIDLHVRTAGKTGERAVGGTTAGLIGLGQVVTWRARHFGVRQLLTVRITQFDRPRCFVDTMVRGAFRQMEHHHYFEPNATGTLMRDEFSFESPMGLLGRIANMVFLERYMRRFLRERNLVLKAVAESEAWREYIH